jgi:hypothetical protein
MQNEKLKIRNQNYGLLLPLRVKMLEARMFANSLDSVSKGLTDSLFALPESLKRASQNLLSLADFSE